MLFPTLSTPPSLTAGLGEPNAGGLARLRIVPAHLVTLIHPEPYPLPARTGYPPLTVSGQHLLFASGVGSLTDIDLVSVYSSFLEKPESGPSGPFYRPALQLALPKVRPDVVAWVQQYRAVKWLAFLKDRNGYCRLVGTPDQPLTLTAEMAQPAGNGNNQTVLTFTADVEHPAYFLTGVDDADLLAAGPFSVAFGFMFDS